jgi:hypothetical protein
MVSKTRFSWALHHWVIALSVATCGLAQAQSYTVKELKKTVGSQWCKLPFPQNSAALLNGAGDVVGVCNTAAYFAIGAGVNLLFTGSAVSKPVVWRAGGAPTALAVPSRTKFHDLGDFGLGVTNNGDIYGAVVKPVNWLGFEANVDDQKPVVWQASKPSILALPAGLTGRWDVIGISHGGTLLLHGPSVYDIPTTTSSPDQGYAVVVNGRAVRLPALPADSDVTLQLRGRMVVNDRGQVAYAGWFWTGEAWKPMNLPEGTTLEWIDAINNRGQVSGGLVAPPSLPPPAPLDDRVEHLRGIRFVWSEQGTTVYPGMLAFQSSGQAAMNDQGQVVGAVALHQGGSSNIESRAALWQPGQAAIDLNTVLTLPKDVIFTGALAINEKGQILVDGGGTYIAPRHFVITPK